MRLVTRLKLAFAWLFLALLAAPLAIAAPTDLSRGAVAAPDRFGAEAGVEILRAGGNAVDAAIGTAFVLAVTYPEAGNIGGGGFMTLLVDGKSYFLDYREHAPAAARPDMYLDERGEVAGDASLIGHRAVAVPGTVAGMAAAHRRFGSLPWARLLAPAIRLAEDGFVVPAHLVGIRDQGRAGFGARTNFDTYFGSMKAGERFRQPELAATLRRIRDHGEAGFYAGHTARLLVREMSRAGGLIREADLAAYRPRWLEPLVGRWHEYQVITAPPPSSGGIALLQMLAMKQRLAPAFAGVALNSPDYIHLLAEIEKRVFADRAEYLGDPAFHKVPVAALLDPAYLARRADGIDRQRPSPTPAVQPGLESPQTTHFSIVDRHGNAVANTYTLNGWFGSGVVVTGAGFLLNNEMDDFSAKPGAPNMFGVVGADANAIAPGKTPLSSMTPTILTDNGRVAMVIGTPGGSRIFTSVFQVLTNVYDFGLPLAEAVASQRVHHQLLPADTLFAEPYRPLEGATAEALRARGYRIEVQDFVGDIEAIQIIDGQPVAAADPRARGVALVE